MATGSSFVRQGIHVVQGTPAAPLPGPTLFLRLWKVAPPGGPVRTLASLAVVRPSGDGYLRKELIPETETAPLAALDKAVAIARRGGVAEIYVNADLDRLAPPRRAAMPQSAAGSG